MVKPFTIAGANVIGNVSLVWDKWRNVLKCFKDIWPAETVLDQRHEDVREQSTQRVAAETSLVSVCDAEKKERIDDEIQ